MTGDVSDLIKELDNAIDKKSRLLKHEQGDLAENSIKQLYGKNYSSKMESEGYRPDTEMNRLEDITNQHISKMYGLEQKRDKLIQKMYGKTGKERSDIAKEIEDINYKIEKSQADFNQNYMSQYDVIQDYVSKIGDGLFADIENGNAFKNATEDKKKHFLELKDVLDFSDIKTEEQLFEVERSLNQFLKAANVGKVDIKALETNIKGINEEFAKNGDLDSYNDSMSKLAKEISEVTGVDANILNDLFTQFDTSVLKGKDSLDEFLETFGKTKQDLINDNGFAKALANQKQSIDSWVQSLNDIGYSEEIDLEIAYNLLSDSNLPEQVRDMVRTLLNKGHSATEVLDVAQQVLIDLSDGEVDLESIQTLLDKTFGQGAFEVNSKLLLNPEAELAGVEDVVSRLKEKYGEIPTEIETAIRVDSVTSYMEAERILSMYNNFPDEVKTVISSNGFETLNDLELIQQLFTSLPPEQAMTIVTNYSDIIKESGTLEEVLGRLSNTPIQIEPVVKADGAANALDNLVKQPVKDVVVGIKGDNTDANQKAEETDTKVNDVKQDTPVKIEADASDAISDVTTLDTKIRNLPKSKTVDITVKTTNKTVNPGATGNISDPNTFNHEVQSSVISEGNEIELLSATPVAETVANTSVQNLRAKASNDKYNNNKNNSKNVEVSINLYAELENQLKKISNELDLIESKSKQAFGKDKIDMLEKQNKLLKQQQELQHQIAEGMRKEANEHKDYLSKKGYKFDSDGMVLDYQNKLSAIEKELKALEKSENSAKKEELEKTKSILETYINLTLDKIPDASKEWWDLSNAIKENNKEIEKIRYDAIFEPLKNKLKEVEHALDRVNDKMDLLDKLNDRANGSKKLSYLQKKIDLLKQEQEVLGQMDKAIKDQMLAGQNEIRKYGFSIDGSSLITNYDEILNGLVGTENYEDAKKAADDYIDLVRNKLPDAWKDWLDIENTIKDIQDEIEKLERQMKLFEANSKLKELSMQFDEIADKLSIIDEKMKHAYGKDKLDLIEQQLALLEQQKALQDEIIKGHQSKLSTYQFDLGKYGFTFSDTGTVKNLDEILNKYKDHDDIEKITELVDEYIKLQRDELPDAVLEWEKLNNAIKDAYKEQLNTAKEIEDKITQMYKKQIQDRIDAMNKETEAKKKALKEQQDAYNKYRDDVDYQNSYDDKMSEITDLERQLEIAMKDTSLNGQKKVKELQKLLADAQKELDKLTQQKIDSEINDAFDKESDRLEEENKQNIEELEKEWSDSKIAELVAQALGSGVFTDIEGNVSSLEDALVNFAEETGDLFGVLGSVIKEELIGNLAIAQDTVRDLAEILKTLDVEKHIPKMSSM
ncbi:MAG: hypothetical protein ACRCX8_01785, partial [Sarcina sp.]